MYRYCAALGCGRTARAGTADGLGRYCRSHYDHHQRHGDPFKSRYTAAQLSPHRKQVRAWLKARKGNRWLRNAAERIRGLYERAGPVVEATRLTGLSPRERAWAAWARLRRADVDP